MLRSCYDTYARFYNHDGIVDDIRWYFVPPETPFLPVPSVINSLIWVDKAERIDYGDAGEVPNAGTTYYKGSRNIALEVDTYCGTSADWLGNGTRPTLPLPTEGFGQHRCCGGLPALGIAAITQALVGNLHSNLPGFTWSLGGNMPLSSTWAFESLEAIINNYSSSGLRLDLFEAIPNSSGTRDLITDFTILNYPGYTSQFMYPSLINPDASLGLGGQSMPQVSTWTQIGAGLGSHRTARGMVGSDLGGSVLFYLDLWPPGPGYHPAFAADGDYIEWDWQLGVNGDYP